MVVGKRKKQRGGKKRGRWHGTFRQMSPYRVPFVESGQGLILGHIRGSNFGPPGLELKRFSVCSDTAPAQNDCQGEQR